jgi:hypothetical protein
MANRNAVPARAAEGDLPEIVIHGGSPFDPRAARARSAAEQMNRQAIGSLDLPKNYQG